MVNTVDLPLSDVLKLALHFKKGLSVYLLTILPAQLFRLTVFLWYSFRLVLHDLVTQYQDLFIDKDFKSFM